MPTLAEFILTVSTRHHKGEERFWTLFRFETVRQFRSFRYEVDVDDAIDHEKKNIVFTLKGVHAPSMLMPSVGSAKNELVYPDLKGEYSIKIHGAKSSGEFRLHVSSKGIRLLEATTPDFVQVRLDPEIEVIGE